ncbi:MAG: DMT family transporter [Bacteroidetes bacterium]|nr:DMT family transporter [Bacteroidota bacterium]
MVAKIVIYGGLLATAAIWGGSFVVMKDALEKQDVYSFLATRFLIASLIMFALRPKVFSGLSKKFVIRSVVAGCFLVGGYTFQTLGLTLTTVSNTGFITGLYLVFAPLISWIVLKRKFYKAHGLAVFCAALGLYLIAYDGIKIGLGEILVLISAVLWGGHIVILSEWSDGKNNYAMTLIQILVSAFILVFISILNGYESPPDYSVWNAIILTALFATVFAFFMQTKAQSVLTATAAAVLLAMEVPFALAFGLYFNNDPLTARIVIGGSLIMLAMSVIIWWDNKNQNYRNSAS